MQKMRATFDPADRSTFSSLLSRVVGKPVESYRVAARPPDDHHYGLGANKYVLDVTIWTAGGDTRGTKLFAKEGIDAVHELVHGLGGPVPEFYGHVKTTDGRDWGLCEWVEINDVWFEEEEQDFLRDSQAFPALLQALARLNALKPPNTFGQGHGWEAMLGAAPNELAEIWELAAEGHLGSDLQRLCLNSNTGLARLQGLSARLLPLVRSMPTAFSHRDFCLYHCGKRTTGEFALIDVSGCGHEPRFFDIAPWLGPPDSALPKCMSRTKLGAHYLAALSNAGGGDVPLEALLRETETLWVAWYMAILTHLKSAALEGYDNRPEEHRDRDRRDAQSFLYRRLESFIALGDDFGAGDAETGLTPGRCASRR